MDGFKTGDVVFICHYSGLNPFKCIVVEADNDVIVGKLVKEFAAMSFIKGDPAVIGFEKDSEMVIMGCIITGIEIRQNIAEIKIDSLEPGAEQRQWERFPVSLYADVRLDGSRKKELVTIKDISCYGMLIFSEADLPKNVKLDIDIYMEKKIFFLKTNIARKVKNEYYYEYGVGIVYEDSSSLNIMRDYVQRLKKEQEDLIRKQNEK